MTKVDKAKLFDERGIQHRITTGRRMQAYVVKIGSDGKDYSEWKDASEIIDQIKDEEEKFYI